jgi:hypothetical protein
MPKAFWGMRRGRGRARPAFNGRGSSSLPRRDAAGWNCGDAGPENLAANSQRLGNEFETLSARNTLQMDPQFGRDIGAAVRNYDRVRQTLSSARLWKAM